RRHRPGPGGKSGGQGDDLRLLDRRQRQLVPAVDLVHRRTMEPDRGRLLTKPDTAAWLSALIGRAPRDEGRFRQALTHGSANAANYERLEFLGDRVLGLLISEWLYDRFSDEPEGKLSRRFNALVSGETCAE